MALATKCPHCNTIFRVAADQLKLRGGIVRCGTCHDVFDGNAALLDVSAIMAPKALAGALAPAPAAPPVAAFLIPTVDFDTSYDPFGILPARAQIHPAAAGLLVPQLDDKLELPPGVVPPAVSGNAPHALESPLELAIALPVEQSPESPLELAMESPLESPIELPVESAVELALESPIESAAEFHSELLVEFPAEPPSDLFVELPVEAPAQQFMEPPLESPSELAADPFVDLPIEASLDPFLDPHTQLPVEQATEPRLESSDKLPAALLVELPLEVPVDLSSELLVELPVELPIDLSAELLVELPVDPFFELHEPVHDAGAEELAQPATPYAEPADPQAFEPSAPEHFEPAPAHDAEPSESHHFEPPEPPGGKREPSFAALLTNHDEHILAIAAPAYELPETAAPTRAAEVKADDIDEPGFVKQVRRRERSGKAMRIAMGLGSVALLITLLGQGVSTFRNQLAARLPQIKPALVSACAMLDCRVELPAQIEAIAIEQGELQSLSESSFSYASVLHNQSGTAQAWPDIELILNDAADKPVLRRVITPREYLPPTTDVAKGFATHSEQAVKLYFELAQLKASGYHIAVFYP